MFVSPHLFLYRDGVIELIKYKIKTRLIAIDRVMPDIVFLCPGNSLPGTGLFLESRGEASRFRPNCLINDRANVQQEETPHDIGPNTFRAALVQTTTTTIVANLKGKRSAVYGEWTKYRKRWRKTRRAVQNRTETNHLTVTYR